MLALVLGISLAGSGYDAADQGRGTYSEAAGLGGDPCAVGGREAEHERSGVPRPTAGLAWVAVERASGASARHDRSIAH